MSNEELSALIKDSKGEDPEKNKYFEVELYPKMNLAEKAKYWSGALHTQMRWQVESGLDPYAIFSLNMRFDVLNTEPEFDFIMKIVFETYWKDIWDYEEYKKRVFVK